MSDQKCENCRFHYNAMNCHRYPEIAIKEPEQWCGEWQQMPVKLKGEALPYHYTSTAAHENIVGDVVSTVSIQDELLTEASKRWLQLWNQFTPDQKLSRAWGIGLLEIKRLRKEVAAYKRELEQCCARGDDP